MIEANTSSGLFIQQIELYSSRVPLKKPFVISLGQLDVAEHVIVVIRTQHGFTGFGECSPFRTIHGENADTGMSIGKELAQVLLNRDALQITAAHELMNAFVYGNSCIKSAFDIALHDIASQYAAVPLYQFLNGKNNKQLLTDYTISIGLPEQMAEDARWIQSAGFGIIKVKLGESTERDVRRIRLIREAVGPDITIRIDANQGWNKETAIKTLNALESYNIQHCEEPIPRWCFMELAAVKAASPIPIMADESCFDHHDAERLIQLNACDSINIKLGKSGGIHGAMKIVQSTEAAGMALQVGGFLESRLGFAAAAHFALTSDRIRYIDFDTPLMFSEDHVQGGITYGKNGLVQLPESPGLGASYPVDYLNTLPRTVITKS